MNRPPVRSEPHQGGTLLRVILDRPKGNILDADMMAGLHDALSQVAGLPGLRLVVLQGAGGHFSFGASVEEHRAADAPAMLSSFHRLCRTVAACPVPVAALVEGRCLGGAFELALCTHLIFAGERAAFGCPEVRLGVFPPVLAAVGTLRLGASLTQRLLLTGETLYASALERAGTLVAVFPGDPWEGLLEWYGRNLRDLSAQALRTAVAALRQAGGLAHALDGPLEDLERLYLQRVLPSHDGNEGIAAFLEKRPPRWEDR